MLTYWPLLCTSTSSDLYLLARHPSLYVHPSKSEQLPHRFFSTYNVLNARLDKDCSDTVFDLITNPRFRCSCIMSRRSLAELQVIQPSTVHSSSVFFPTPKTTRKRRAHPYPWSRPARPGSQFAAMTMFLCDENVQSQMAERRDRAENNSRKS